MACPAFCEQVLGALGLTLLFWAIACLGFGCP
jgi:hypothetical protein